MSVSITIVPLPRARIYIADQSMTYSLYHTTGGNSIRVDNKDTIFIDALAGNVVIELPPPPLTPEVYSKDESITIILKRIDAGPASVNVTSAGGALIDGNPQIALASMEIATLQTDGTNWWTV